QIRHRLNRRIFRNHQVEGVRGRLVHVGDELDLLTLADRGERGYVIGLRDVERAALDLRQRRRATGDGGRLNGQALFLEEALLVRDIQRHRVGNGQSPDLDGGLLKAVTTGRRARGLVGTAATGKS